MHIEGIKKLPMMHKPQYKMHLDTKHPHVQSAKDTVVKKAEIDPYLHTTQELSTFTHCKQFTSHN